MGPFLYLPVKTGRNKKAAPKGAAFLWVANVDYFEDAFFFSTVTFASTVVGVAASVS